MQHDDGRPAETTFDGLEGLLNPPFSRRGFVMTSLMTGLTLAATRVEAQAIATDSEGIEAGEVGIPTGDGPMPGYRAMPQGEGPFPIVLVIEEIFGVHDYIKDICRRLAKAGYCAVAPELYARQGDLSTMTDAKVIVRDVISKTPDAQWIADLDATAAYAASAARGDGKRLGTMGWCRGRPRGLALRRASPRPEGGCGLVRSARRRAHADPAQDRRRRGRRDPGADPGAVWRPGCRHPVAAVEEARDRARAAGKSVELVVYPDAPHGFHADYRPSYRKADAEDGWMRALAFLKANGVG